MLLQLVERDKVERATVRSAEVSLVFVSVRGPLQRERKGTNTSGATPCSKAWRHREAHTHHESPCTSPGKRNCGAGVVRSLPVFLEKLRKRQSTCAHTTCEPWSDSSVEQLPVRK